MTLDLRRRGEQPLRIGHRGAAALAPENTLESFERALALGVDGVEFDVGVFGNEQDLEVAHDRMHTSGLALNVALGYFAERHVIVHVDLKTSGGEAALVDALRSHGLVDRTVVSSFDAASIRTLAALEPALARSFTYPQDRFGATRRPVLAPAIRGTLAVLRRVLPRRVGSLLAQAGNPAALTLQHTVVTRAAVEACHAHGAALWVWTVNDAELAAQLGKIGADAIISDDPRIFRVAAERAGRA